MTFLEEKRGEIRGIVSDIFYEGVECGGVEYGDEAWSSRRDTDKLMGILEQTLREFADKVRLEKEEQKIVEKLPNGESLAEFNPVNEGWNLAVDALETLKKTLLGD